MRKELDLYRSRRPFRLWKGPDWLRSFYVPGAAVLLAGLLLTGLLTLQNRALEREAEGIRAWMAETEGRALRAEKAWAYHEALLTRLTMAEDLTAALASYPKLTSKLMDSVSSIGGVTMTLESWEGETLSFRVESPEVIDIPACVLALRETGLFLSVDYGGYRYHQGRYLLELTCVPAGEGGGL